MPPKTRSFEQIVAELDPAFKPQRQLLAQQKTNIPNTLAAGRQRLEAQKGQAFGDITEGANRRGLNFSGIPIAEQAEFTSDVFLPGLTDLESQAQQQEFSLQSALNDLAMQQRIQAQNIRQAEEDRLAAFQASQRAAAAQAASLGSLFGAGGGGSNQGPQQAAAQGSDPEARIFKKNNTDGSGGFGFVDGAGNAISAEEFARATGQNFFDLLRFMAREGDEFARDAFNQVKGPGFSAEQRRRFAPLFAGFNQGQAAQSNNRTPAATSSRIPSLLPNPMGDLIGGGIR